MFLTPGHTIEILDTGSSFSCRSSESVLMAMARQGKKGIPVGCRSGGCGACKIHVEKGEYDVGIMSRAHVSENEESEGFVLACRCNPQSDLTIRIVGKMRKATQKL